MPFLPPPSFPRPLSLAVPPSITRVAIANWTIEPPGLFQGRGQHPKMGMLKRRVVPEQIIINCSAGARVPDPPSGHRWKEVRHDNTVTWLAGWKENVQDQNKYVQLAAETHIKGRSDWKKYETARELKKHVNKIRKDYTEDLKSSAVRWRRGGGGGRRKGGVCGFCGMMSTANSECCFIPLQMADRQRATALYFIDKLALRAGGEKDADEEADTGLFEGGCAVGGKTNGRSSFHSRLLQSSRGAPDTAGERHAQV